MNQNKNFLPIARRHLLFIAGCTYTIAGCMLIKRALTQLIGDNQNLAIEILCGIIGGVIFYFALFTRISKRHIVRITGLQDEYPGFFSFFGLRSYVMMAIMITAGITIRLTGLIKVEYLYTFYIAMGLPLLVSAVRFFTTWNKIKNSTK